MTVQPSVPMLSRADTAVSVLDAGVGPMLGA